MMKEHTYLLTLVGIVKIKSSTLTSVVLVIELTDKIERMPEPLEYEIEGIKLPLIRINPFEDSAPEKVLCALSLLCGFKNDG